MLKFRSLKLTIVFRFLLILTPIVLVLIYQVYANGQRAAAAAYERETRLLAQQAQDDYRLFLNGLVDAVDTGSVSARSLQSLDRASNTLMVLQKREGDSNVDALLSDTAWLAQTIAPDPRIDRLVAHQPFINKIKDQLQTLVAKYEARVQKNISDFAHDVRTLEWITLVVMGVTLLAALTFVYELAKPLTRAVTLANEIAAGGFKSDTPIDTRQDIGGLLASLSAMRSDLRTLFMDLTKSRHRLANAQHIAGIGDWEMSLATRTLICSDETYEIFHRPHDSFGKNGASPLQFVHPEDRRLVEDMFYAVEHRGDFFDTDFRILTPQGETRYLHGQAELMRDEHGTPVTIAGTVQDITQRKLAEQKIQHLAQHDVLTGLPNRSLFMAQSEKALAVAERVGQTIATLFLDMDRFKNINDSLGHEVGDVLLRETANRIFNCLRRSDLSTYNAKMVEENMVARMGGDEFTLLLINLRQAEDAARVAERMLAALSVPFEIDGVDVVVTASIGIAIYPVDGTDNATLLTHANAAMYHAKAEGRNNYQFFTQSMKTEASRKLSIENDLRKALAQHQFILHFQPQVDIATRTIFGVEALIRWQHPTRGIIPPLEFISVAEECGLIGAISEWVLWEACTHASAWHRAGLPKISVAVNMASPSFRQSALLRQVAATLEGCGLPAQYLELEVTESIMMQDLDAVIPLLTQLKEMGVQLSIDDFGTGYSSLSYLQRFPLDTLKIDRAFINAMGTRQGDALVQAIIAMGKGLNLHVIAEGVETEAQAKFLAEHQCETLQGFLFSPPVPADQIVTLLRDQMRHSQRPQGRAPKVA